MWIECASLQLRHFVFSYRKTELLLMEKTLNGTRNEWKPFQIYPTNMLQLILEFMPAVLRSEPESKLKAIFDKHTELLGTGIGVDIMYENSGMARNSSLYR